MEVLYISDGNQIVLPRRAYGLGPLLSYLKEHNVDCEALFEITHINPLSISDPNAVITPQQERQFNQAAINATCDPALGLAIGPRFHYSAFGILGLAIMSSATIRTGIAPLFTLPALFWSSLQWRLLLDGQSVILEATEADPLGTCMQYMLERDFSSFTRMCDDMLGRHLPLSEMRFSYPAPTHAHKYAEVFQCPIHFGAQSNELRFDACWLDAELPQANPVVCQIFQTQCRELVTELMGERSFAQIVGSMIVDGLGNYLSEEQIADKLHVSPRTLRRKLAKEGTNFQGLVTAMRRNLAKELLLSQELSVKQVAERLGYSDSASFHHAFKRWTGVSPSSYR